MTKKLSWGPGSKAHRRTVEPLLNELSDSVLETGFDHSIIEGSRSKYEQNDFFQNGVSKVQWPKSYHNVDGVIRKKSWAIDATPYPFPCWPDPKKQRPEIYGKDLGRMYTLAALYRAKAMEKGILIITGSDWDNDWNFRDQTFDDLPHIQLVSLERLKPKIDESEYEELVEKASKYDQMKEIMVR